MQKSDFLLILKITIFWILVSILQFLVGYGTMIEMGYDFAAQGQDPLVGLRTGLITGLAAGVFGGTLIVLAWEKWLRSVSYSKALVRIFISYTIVFLLVAYISILYFNSSYQDLNISNPALWIQSLGRIFRLNTLVPYFF